MIRIERYSRPRRKRWDWSGMVAEGVAAVYGVFMVVYLLGVVL